ncbi:hypothetical protein UVI_02058610 [Ustilaginoidea virens]|uniref:Uncharacterized protein n=1 Tax=Ustilaginoidea virens TaxID=1159556 RepID=A0A1B5L519_USTVR|nr:hypothetical protein UVI_02058610 [Ustilaginoidea virens]
MATATQSQAPSPWPKPRAITNKSVLDHSDLSEGKGTNSINVFGHYAYQQMGYMTAEELHALLTSGRSGLVVKVVDCQDKIKMTKKIINAVEFDIKDNVDSYNEPAFKARRDNAQKYQAADLFPTRAEKLPDAVVFVCDMGMARSHITAYWYARHLIRTFNPPVSETTGQLATKTRIYVLEGGLKSVQGLSAEKQNAIREWLRVNWLMVHLRMSSFLVC